MITRKDLDRLGVTYGPTVRLWWKRGERQRCAILDAADRLVTILGKDMLWLYKLLVDQFEAWTGGEEAEEGRRRYIAQQGIHELNIMSYGRELSDAADREIRGCRHLIPEFR